MKIEDIPEVVKKSQAHDMPCIICGSPTRDRAIYTPGDPVKSGVGKPRPGKERSILYAICPAHSKNEYTATMVEEIIRTNHQAGREIHLSRPRKGQRDKRT